MYEQKTLFCLTRRERTQPLRLKQNSPRKGASFFYLWVGLIVFVHWGSTLRFCRFVGI